MSRHSKGANSCSRRLAFIRSLSKAGIPSLSAHLEKIGAGGTYTSRQSSTIHPKVCKDEEGLVDLSREYETERQVHFPTGNP
jgi:hypothetical protein